VGDRDLVAAVYDYTATRERAGPEEFLKNYHGHLQADAYVAFDAFFTKPERGMVEVGCWAHAAAFSSCAGNRSVAHAHRAAVDRSAVWDRKNGSRAKSIWRRAEPVAGTRIAARLVLKDEFNQMFLPDRCSQQFVDLTCRGLRFRISPLFSPTR